MVQAALADAPPRQGNQFFGDLSIGEEGGAAAGGRELRVKAKVGEDFVAIPLSDPTDPFTTSDGTFGILALFEVPADDPDTPERDGANDGQELAFFVVTDYGNGDASTKVAQVVDDAQDVDIVLEPSSSEFVQGQPFEFNIKVFPGGQPVNEVGVFLGFDPTFLQVESIGAGSVLDNVLLNTFDNGAGTIDFSATTAGGAPTTEFVLATVTVTPTVPTTKTSIDFSFVPPRLTEAAFGGGSVLKSVAGLEMVRLVRAETVPPQVLFGGGVRS